MTRRVKYIVTELEKLPKAYCPKCEKHIEMFLLEYHKQEDAINYCPYCGQHLDWRGEIEFHLKFKNGEVS